MKKIGTVLRIYSRKLIVEIEIAEQFETQWMKRVASKVPTLCTLLDIYHARFQLLQHFRNFFGKCVLVATIVGIHKDTKPKFIIHVVRLDPCHGMRCGTNFVHLFDLGTIGAFVAEPLQWQIKTTLLLAEQLITCLERLHEFGYVHGNVKPGNFVMGLGDKKSKGVHDRF